MFAPNKHWKMCKLHGIVLAKRAETERRRLYVPQLLLKSKAKQTQTSQRPGHIPVRSGLWLAFGLLGAWGPWPPPVGTAQSLVAALPKWGHSHSRWCPAGRSQPGVGDGVLAPAPSTGAPSNLKAQSQAMELPLGHLEPIFLLAMKQLEG